MYYCGISRDLSPHHYSFHISLPHVHHTTQAYRPHQEPNQLNITSFNFPCLITHSIRNVIHPKQLIPATSNNATPLKAGILIPFFRTPALPTSENQAFRHVSKKSKTITATVQSPQTPASISLPLVLALSHLVCGHIHVYNVLNLRAR